MGELNGTIPWDLDNLVVDLHTSKPICVVHLGQVVLRGMKYSPKVCRDAFSLQYSSNSGTGSLCSRQPFEQFGVAGKLDVGSGDHGTVQSSSAQESTSTVDLEAKLLESFRSCIVKMHDCSNALRDDQRYGDGNFLSKGMNGHCSRRFSLS